MNFGMQLDRFVLEVQKLWKKAIFSLRDLK